MRIPFVLPQIRADMELPDAQAFTLCLLAAQRFVAYMDTFAGGEPSAVTLGDIDGNKLLDIDPIALGDL